MHNLNPLNRETSELHKSIRGYDRDLEFERAKSTAWAWRITAVSMAITVLAVAAVVVQASRFRPFGFMVTVDRATGETSTVKLMDRGAVEFTEMHDKHNVNRFVASRERYFYRLLQADYDATMALSSEAVAKEYAALFEGDRALDKVLGAGTERKVEILSTRLPKDRPGTAIVSFEKTERRANAPQSDAPQRFIATLTFEYKPRLTAPERELVENPSGFKVLAYRADPELTGSAK